MFYLTILKIVYVTVTRGWHDSSLLISKSKHIFWEFKRAVSVRPIKKIPVFRVTGPYLNLLMKPRLFFRFSGKNIILCILKGKIAFQNA